MSAGQLAQRILCAEARVDLQKIRSGRINEGDWGAIAEASNLLSKLDLYIDDSPGLTILEARAKGKTTTAAMIAEIMERIQREDREKEEAQKRLAEKKPQETVSATEADDDGEKSYEPTE